MRLSQLEPFFFRCEPEGVLRHLPGLAGADGIEFLCPLCFQRNGGSVGTHGVLVCFEGGNAPPDFGKDSEGNTVRWHVAGAGVADLSTTPSIFIKVGCGWHGYITAGEIVGGLDAHSPLAEGTAMTDEANALAEAAEQAKVTALVQLLDNSIRGLKALLDLHGHPLPDLRLLRIAEVADKNRVGALAAIDAEIAFIEASVQALTGGESGVAVSDARDPISFSRDSERADGLLDILAERPVRVVFGSEDRELLELKPVRTNPADWGRDGDRAVLRRAINIDGESRKATVRTLAIVDDDDAVLGVCEIPGSGLIVGAGHKALFAPGTLVF